MQENILTPRRLATGRIQTRAFSLWREGADRYTPQPKFNYNFSEQ